MGRTTCMDAGDRSAAILRAASEIFAEEGYAAARMEAIAARAGVTKGLIYFYFKNKMDLFEAVFRESVRKPVQGVLVRVNPAESMASHLAHVLSEIYEQFVATPFFSQLVRLMALEGGKFPELRSCYFREVIRPLLGILNDLAEEGARRGEWKREALPAYPHTLLAPVILFGLWRGTFQEDMPLDSARYCRDHQKAMLRALGLDEEAVNAALSLADRKRASSPRGEGSDRRRAAGARASEESLPGRAVPLPSSRRLAIGRATRRKRRKPA